MEIIPAILPKDFQELNDKIFRVLDIVKMVQIDICDGVFVKTVSWPFLSREDSRDIEFEEHFNLIMEEEAGLPYWEDMNFELDLMVKNAHKSFDKFLKLGPSRIIFHIEAEDKKEFGDFLDALDPYTRENIQIGIAINTTTLVEKLEPIINYIDFIQCMGIEHEGQQGQPYDDRVIGQIKKLKILYPEIDISVDGGVSLETASSLKEAGADRLVIGSAIFNSEDIKETIWEFEEI